MAIDVVHGKGYRILSVARTIGAPTSDPDGFVVLYRGTNRILIASGGVWTDGGTFPNSHFTLKNLTSWSAGQNLDFDFFVNHVYGNDSNSGITPDTAWLTTTKADAQVLTSGQKIGYLFKKKWVLYRTLNMTVDLTTLTMDIITGGADEF